MKTKLTFLLLLLLIQAKGFTQYIAVKARYTETRLVDDAPNPPKRENRLLLSFFEVGPTGVFTPAQLSNYSIWVYKQGLQYGNVMGGVLDSSGNNYPGYTWPAPIAVSYYNSLGSNYTDCDPNATTHFVVNGHELDCGFVTVSYWDIDNGTGVPFEAFPAPNICLPYYFWPDPYSIMPGNLNFPYAGAHPYNWYSYSCPNSTQQLVIRGVLAHADSTTMQVPLPVQFADVTVVPEGFSSARLSWSNLTESDIAHYIIERSVNGGSFIRIDTVLPIHNNGSRADYTLIDSTVQRGDDLLYRVLAVELNGKQIYSPVVHLQLPMRNLPQEEPELLLFPNPVTGNEFTIRMKHAPGGRYLLYFITPSGQPIRHKMIEHTTGDLVRTVDLSGLPVGIYRAVLRSNSHTFSQTFIYTR